MGTTLPAGTRGVTPPPPVSAPVRLPVECDRVDDRAARILGCSVAHAKRLRLTLAEVANALVVAMRDHPVLRERFLRDLRSVGVNAMTLAHTADLEHAAQVADLQEDVAQHEWDLTRSPEALRRLIAAKERAVALESDELAALVRLAEEVG